MYQHRNIDDMHCLQRMNRGQIDVIFREHHQQVKVFTYPVKYLNYFFMY